VKEGKGKGKEDESVVKKTEVMLGNKYAATTETPSEIRGHAEPSAGKSTDHDAVQETGGQGKPGTASGLQITLRWGELVPRPKFSQGDPAHD
jgi:hypothetical protein